ncbi:BEACH domain-containing protein, partial [Baffinella frigidus]
YLQALNTFAGRSLNDLTQYPVFPWVLRDYTSPELDLSDPASFRDFAKPIGAQSAKQEAKFRERYASWCDPETPAFHFGTHYSTPAGYVLWYLTRIEPYTTWAVHLQGGRFDCPDRLFSSVGECFQNCTTTMNDVKELTPEWFYLPHFLRNDCAHDLGVDQKGRPVENVALPPWANGSAETFIRVHRDALESDFVSEHIHLWIDLIFGVKQRGTAAADACNAYYYLTYEKAVDTEGIADPQARTPNSKP